MVYKKASFIKMDETGMQLVNAINARICI